MVWIAHATGLVPLKVDHRFEIVHLVPTFIFQSFVHRHFFILGVALTSLAVNGFVLHSLFDLQFFYTVTIVFLCSSAVTKNIVYSHGL